MTAPAARDNAHLASQELGPAASFATLVPRAEATKPKKIQVQVE